MPRGSVVCAGEHHPDPSYRLDVLLLGGAVVDPSGLGRVQVHHGTRDVPARVVALGADMAQLRLEAPLVARARDRLVLRAIAPPATLGGAAVIDPDPRRHGPGPEAERLRLLREGGAAEIVEQAVLAGSRLPADPGRWHADADLAWALPRHPEPEWRRAVGELLGSGRIGDERAMLAPPAAAPATTERPAPPALDGLDLRLLATLAGDGTEPRPPQALAAALGISRAEAVRRLDLLAAAGRLRRIAADVYYEAGRLERIERLVLELLRRRGSISLAELRDALRTSRKYSQAILEHLDRSGLTVRRGDEHLLRPSARRSSA